MKSARCFLVEERDDSKNIEQASHQSMRNRICRLNIHRISFDAAQDDPNARFNSMVREYESLDPLTDTITQSLTIFQRGHPR